MRLRAWQALGVAIELGFLLQTSCGRSEIFFDGASGYASNGSAGGSRPGSSAGGPGGTAASGGAGGGNGGDGGVNGGQGNGSSTGQAMCQEAGLGNPSGRGCGGGCPKPLICGSDPLAGEGCQRSCKDNSDCPQLYTVCNGDFCQTNLCGLGTSNGVLGGACNAIGINDGMCIADPIDPEAGQAYTVGLCYQAGTSTRCCDSLNATRCSLQDACVAGMLCGNNICGPPCAATATETECPAGETCMTIGDICVPNDPPQCP